MKFIVRLPGYSYGGDEGPGEHKHVCFLTKDGGVTRIRVQAHEYDSEAEAWEHLRASDNLEEAEVIPADGKTP